VEVEGCVPGFRGGRGRAKPAALRQLLAT
jgi:hypothetical protein